MGIRKPINLTLKYSVLSFFTVWFFLSLYNTLKNPLSYMTVPVPLLQVKGMHSIGVLAITTLFFIFFFSLRHYTPIIQILSTTSIVVFAINVYELEHNFFLSIFVNHWNHFYWMWFTTATIIPLLALYHINHKLKIIEIRWRLMLISSPVLFLILTFLGTTGFYNNLYLYQNFSSVPQSPQLVMGNQQNF